MSQPESHEPRGEPAHPATDAHGGGSGHDDHAHGAETLGPIDLQSWGAGALGLLVAVLIAICFALATSGVRG